MSRALLAFGSAMLLAGCATREPPAARKLPQEASSRALTTPSAPAIASSQAPLASSPPALGATAASAAPCGALGCLAFPSVESAFAHVLASNPRILAVGEIHAQKGSAPVPSATRRFTEQLLPALAGRASNLVLELWVASGKCGKVEQRVAEQQRPVSEGQAQGNQGEFVALGRRARELGIEPQALTPSCDEYKAIASAGPADIDRMLQMIAEATLRQLQQLLALPSTADPTMLLAYGGALHNDVLPRAGREHWAFGPQLRASMQGRYVELDLVVPEHIRDSESFRSLSWYAAYDRQRHGTHATLLNPHPGSFVLVFPRTAADPAKDPAGTAEPGAR
ncbi:MAG TPA: hypothetical protein VER33_12320 [Polyangiaceae bacterium]|nr:hypothetical protein [Polyangiaceae bacterium]